MRVPNYISYEGVMHDSRVCLNKPRWKNLWAICAEDVGNYLRPSKQSRPAIGRLPNCSTNSRPRLSRIFLMVAAWLRLLGRILFQIWIQIFIQFKPTYSCSISSQLPPSPICLLASNYPDIWYPLNNKQYKPCNSILFINHESKP